MITMQVRYKLKMGKYQEAAKWLKQYCHITAQYSCAWPEISVKMGSLGDISITSTYNTLGDMEIAYSSLVANPNYAELMDMGADLIETDKTEINVWKTFTEEFNTLEN